MKLSKIQSAGLSVFSNLFLTLLKLVVGLISGSISIIAESAHSGIDLLASLVAYYSVRVSDEPPDHKHPYGHSKIENLSGLIEGALIFVVSLWIIVEGIDRLRQPRELSHLQIGIGIMFVSLILNLVVSRILFKVARQTHSIALEADASHLYSDVLTSGGVIVALILILLSEKLFGKALFWIDPVVSFFIALWILGIGFRVIKKSYPALLDQRAEPELEARVKKLIEDFCGEECAYHKLRTRQAGAKIHLDFHLQFKPETSIEKAHQLSHQLKAELESKFPTAEVIIHLEPLEFQSKSQN